MGGVRRGEVVSVGLDLRLFLPQMGVVTCRANWA